MNILVLKGGNSSEREVSLRSAACVIDALKSNGHTVFEIDTATQIDRLNEFAVKADVVFPILHGEDGEDGAIQKILEGLKVRFLGSNAEVSELCFDKVQFKQFTQKLGYKTPAYDIVTRNSIAQHPLTKSPYVLKPNKAGSSIATFIITDPDKPLPSNAFDFSEQMLLEELIVGTEITVAVVGNKALPVVEIIPPSGAFFNYENKYNGKTLELCPPQNVSLEIQEQARSTALDLHKKAQVRHLSRTDMILKNHELYILEINTMPGMTDQSLLPKAAAADGQNFILLVQRLLQLSIKES